MGSMNYGYYYDQGKKVGYDIETESLLLSFVSSKDKARIVRELKADGHTDINVIKSER